MLKFTNMEVAGFIPQWLKEDDTRSAVQQINAAYQHGGGWNDFEGFKLVGGGDEPYSLTYPNDPPMRELSRATLRDETLVLFQHDWFAVIQVDGSFRVARLD